MHTNPRLLVPRGCDESDDEELYDEEFDDEGFDDKGRDDEGCFGEDRYDEFGDHDMETTGNFEFNRQIVKWVRIDRSKLFTLSHVNGSQLRVYTLDPITTNILMFLPSGYAIFVSDKDQNGLRTQSPEAQRRDIKDSYYIYMSPLPAVLTGS
jgi:hypothetical protein